MPIDRGIVEYFGSTRDEHRCGYCKGTKPALADFGMWAHQLKPLEYLQLMERGWRRSGKYCYKPILNRTCCPPYTIRCDVENFSISKSQKKVVKRMEKFLKDGKVPGQQSSSIGDARDSKHSRRPTSQMSIEDDMDLNKISSTMTENDDVANEDESTVMTSTTVKTISPSGYEGDRSTIGDERDVDKSSSDQCYCTDDNQTGLSQSTNKDPRLSSTISKEGQLPKGRTRRFERSITKLMSRNGWIRDEAINVLKKKHDERIARRRSNASPKTIEDLMLFAGESQTSGDRRNFKHRLSIKFVSTSFVGRKADERDFKGSVLDVEHRVYEKYQIAVHQDDPDECSKTQFTRFLVDSPVLFSPFRSHLCDLSRTHHGLVGFGSYHMQYWLDEKQLIAVSVIDVLPSGISSVYFFYDPKYSWLGLGTYSALSEIRLTRSILKVYLPFRFYYMGFYIHSCPKMRYKGRYRPSYLLCSEAKTWHPIERIITILDRTKYVRLEPNESLTDVDGHDITDRDIGVFFAGHGITTYNVYSSLKSSSSSDSESIDEKVREYATLVGKKCVKSLLLYLD